MGHAGPGPLHRQGRACGFQHGQDGRQGFRDRAGQSEGSLRALSPAMRGDRRMQHPVVSREEWIAARKTLLAKEKQLTRQRDQLSAERRKLPWVRIDKPYVFDGPTGKVTLSDLFDGRSQLVVQHFMFGPDWEEGCVGCSFGADHVDSARLHFEHRDLSFVAVSRTSVANIEAFKRRMGWRFNWVSSLGSDFNYDFNVSFTKDQIASSKVVY